MATTKNTIDASIRFQVRKALECARDLFMKVVSASFNGQLAGFQHLDMTYKIQLSLSTAIRQDSFQIQMKVMIYLFNKQN